MMSRIFLSLLFISLCFLAVVPLLAQAGIPTPVNPTITDELTDQLVAYGNYFLIDDMTSLVENIYTSDCMYLPPGLYWSIQYNRSGVYNWLNRLDPPITWINFTIVETGSDNPNPNLIYQIGLYDMWYDDGTNADDGKFMMLWEYSWTQTVWQIYAHQYNSNLEWLSESKVNATGGRTAQSVGTQVGTVPPTMNLTRSNNRQRNPSPVPH